MKTNHALQIRTSAQMPVAATFLLAVASFSAQGEHAAAAVQIGLTSPWPVASVLRNNSKTRSIPTKGTSPATMTMGSKE